MGDTLGRVTLGMMTTLRADGASFFGALGSPPGWYWYLPEPPPSSHGLLLAASATRRSEEALVGDRAAVVSNAGIYTPGQARRRRGRLQKCHPATPKMPLMMASRTYSSGSRLAPVLMASLLAWRSAAVAVPLDQRTATGAARRRGAARKAVRATKADMAGAIGCGGGCWRG